MPSKEKDLDPVSDLKIVKRYFQYGVEFKENISCYLRDSNLHFDCLMISGETKNLLLELEITDESFAKLNFDSVNALSGSKGEIRLSYPVSQATFFVHGRVQEYGKRRLIIKADLPMFKLQRREALRMRVMESHKGKVKLGDKEFPLYDLSASGLSVIASQVEGKNFQKQQRFPDSKLSFMGKEIKVDLELKNLIKHSKDGEKIRIGLRFRSLSASVEQMIAREAYLQEHKIWSRWL